jgi:glyoxylase-like metal-dependent hydrolase (beta-lactamase superfamily II)
MRKIAPGIFIESKYPALQLGVVTSNDGLLLIDSPLLVEDGRDWIASVRKKGQPRYLALLDAFPDRVLGARSSNLRLIAHDATRKEIRNWPDTFKGNANPIGAEADRLKRITGVQRAVPELTFSREMILHLGERVIHFIHKPGPQRGAIWVVLRDAGVAFIGDAVTKSEPPYLGKSNLDQWHQALDEMRDQPFEDYKLIGSRDGEIEREDVNAMARFLRKIPVRLDRMKAQEKPLEAAAKYAQELLEDFSVAKSRRDLARLRLEAGLKDLYQKLYAKDG